MPDCVAYRCDCAYSVTYAGTHYNTGRRAEDDVMGAA